MKQVLLALLLVACYVAADKAAEWQIAHEQAEEKGYTAEERHQMDDLVGFAIKQSEKVTIYRNPKLKQQQAAVLAKVYHITPENMSNDIFGRW